jgi:hypothetical protein
MIIFHCLELTDGFDDKKQQKTKEVIMGNLIDRKIDVQIIPTPKRH